MEHYYYFRYTWGYETPRNLTTTGEATPTGHPVVESRETSVGGSADIKRLQELGLPVVRGLQKEGARGASLQTDPRPTAQVIQDTEASVDAASSGRPFSLRLSYGPVDFETDRSIDPEAVSHSLPPQPCLAVTSRYGVELPETGAPSPPTGRSGDRPLEEVPLAAYKKTLKDLAPIWSSSMNPVSCSSPMWPAPGARKAKRRSFTIGSNRIGSRRSAPWSCLPSGNGWPSISTFAPAISRGWMSRRSCNICSGICGDPWSCCGIGERSIAVKKSNSGSKHIEDSKWKSSRPTPRNSIPRNLFGTNLTAPWPTVRPRMWSSLTECFETRCDESVGRKNSFGPVSTLLIYPGPDKSSFLY